MYSATFWLVWSVIASTPVNCTDYSFIGTEHYGSVGDHPDKVSSHASIQPTQSFIPPHFQEGLEKGVVLALISGHFLPESGSTHLCIGIESSLILALAFPIVLQQIAE